MYRKCFFKNKGVLSRRFVASGLAAVFSAGMFGSYAGAMRKSVNVNTNVNVSYQDFNKKLFDHNPSKKDLKKGEKLRNSTSQLEKINAAESFVKNDVVGERSVYDFLNDTVKKDSLKDFCDLYRIFNLGKDELIKFLAELMLNYFDVGKNKSKWKTFNEFTGSFNNNDDMMREVLRDFFKSDKKEEIMEKYIKRSKNFIKPKQKTFDEYNNNINNINKNKNHIQNLNLKNKLFSKWKLILSLIGVGFVVFIVIILSVKGKSNTDNNKDDEKVNPPIDPENPLTDPKSDDENLEQKKQEQGSQEQKSSIGLEILKGAGTAAAGGTLSGGGTYLVNEVLKRGKSSEVKNSKNIDDRFTYLDSNVNEVTKTEEGGEVHNINGGTKLKDIGDSDTNQFLEDEDAEKTEEGQEEILERSALSDDTEATSDEEKNKD